MLLSPDRGRGWVRGLQASSATRPVRHAMPRKMRTKTVNRTERRPLTPPLPLVGERSMMTNSERSEESGVTRAQFGDLQFAPML